MILTSGEGEEVGGVRLNAQEGEEVGGVRLNAQEVEEVGGVRLNAQEGEEVGGVRLTSGEGEEVGADERIAPRPGDPTRRQCILQAHGGRAAASRLLRDLRGRHLVSTERTHRIDRGFR